MTAIQIHVSHNGINILGQNGLTKLNISITLDKFSTVSSVESFTPQNLQEVLNLNLSSATVMVKEKLFLQKGAIPKFCKLHKLPFALKPVEGMSLTD